MSNQVKVITPVGTARGLFVSGEASTKFDSRGVYNATVAIPKANAEKLIAVLEQAVDASYLLALEDAKPADKGKIVKVPAYELEYDSETGTKETGNILIKAKMVATIKDRSGNEIKRKPALFDADGKRCDDTCAPSTGSKVALSLNLAPYYVAGQKQAGIGRYLQAVKIYELCEYESGGGSDFDNVEVPVGINKFQAPTETNEEFQNVSTKITPSQHQKMIDSGDVDNDILDALTQIED